MAAALDVLEREPASAGFYVRQLFAAGAKGRRRLKAPRPLASGKRSIQQYFNAPRGGGLRAIDTQAQAVWVTRWV
jgi:hypothetical protein